MNLLIYVILALLSVLNIIVPVSGSATVTPFLATLTDPHTAVGLASFYFLLSSLIRIFLFRKLIHWEYVKKLLPISTVGAVLGALSLIQISDTLLLLIVMGFTLFFIYKKLLQHY